METVISFIIIFGALVFFHEFGHFLFAKRAGILVREFAIGMGPKILGITKGETLYTLRLLPIGGYVRMAGEDMDTIHLQAGHRIGVLLNKEGQAKKIIMNQKHVYPEILFLEVEEADLEKELWIKGYDEDEKLVRIEVARDAVVEENGRETILAPYDRQFDSKSVGKRFMTIFAGPLFNFILAFLIFTAIGMMQGVPTFEPIITEVTEESPASEAGMQDGDLVTEIEGNSIATWDELVESVQNNAGNPLEFNIERDGQSLDFTITPEISEQSTEEIGVIGVLYQSPVEKDFLGSFAYGAEQTIFWFKEIFRLLGMLVTGQFTIDALSGPVGIYKTTEEVAKYGFFTLMSWAGMLSINLGIMNLLPLPALDGGRLMFFILEAVRGKPVDRQKEGMVHFVGIMLLMLLMIVVTWNDIQKYFF
ncbi:zinc metalloprotease Lmo1318 [Planococcus antarcticus DSM 14505]|uniref:Zinc metalloprotease n=1 Tax=Planococcus antarcticus DSM 14505 TaxID=1185653 RepID=A0A1C7DGL5_9BACL|nr:RIP metalloprotease RseP [Planococcus antarcticus]ANU10552.1 RIP metalloprotease RseP [Planococcus antarcticus DSM 14505]EIM08373.1 zinc metalloprotease Lmo1318 [Planococcus antarcticus DSM 14505]